MMKYIPTETQTFVAEGGKKEQISVADRGLIMRALGKLHGFLAAQSFYAIVLSSLLAGAIFAGGAYYSRSWVHHYLVWNLFLAWVPYLCSMAAAAWHRLMPRYWWVLPIPMALWLVFFPNAFYIVTDFLHLEDRPPVPLWYDIGLFATFAWTGCFLAVASLYTMQRLVELHLGRFVGWLFALAVLSLNGLAIYLGRFDRWNSWDLLRHPRGVLADVAIRVTNPFSYPRFFGFSLMFSLLLFVCYLMFVSFRRSNDLDK